MQRKYKLGLSSKTISSLLTYGLLKPKELQSTIPCSYNKEERYSRVPRLSDTRYSAKYKLRVFI